MQCSSPTGDSAERDVLDEILTTNDLGYNKDFLISGWYSEFILR